jgi:hypothetical protein
MCLPVRATCGLQMSTVAEVVRLMAQAGDEGSA